LDLAQLEPRALERRVLPGANVFDRRHDADIRDDADALDACATRPQQIGNRNLRLAPVG
jgi:hypothetical protein